MPTQSSASAQEVRACLAKWTANDWRRAFALAPDLEGSIRRACDVPDHKPLANNTGAVAMPVLKRLGQLEYDELHAALGPLALRLEERLEQTSAGESGDEAAALELLRRQDDIGPGLAALAGCRLAADAALSGSSVEEQQRRAVGAAQQLLADVQAGRPARPEDLAVVSRWNDELARAALTGRLRQVAEAAVSEGARPVLTGVLDEASAAADDPDALEPDRRDALLALHRLLSQGSWEVADEDVESVEGAFGRKVARVAVAEIAIAPMSSGALGRLPVHGE